MARNIFLFKSSVFTPPFLLRAMSILFWNFVKVGSLDTEITVLEVVESKIFFAPQPWWRGGIFLAKS